MALPGDAPKLHAYVATSYIFDGGTPGQKANCTVGPGGGRLSRAGFLARAVVTGDNLFTLQVNGTAVSPAITILLEDSAVGDYQTVDVAPAVEVEEGDLISWSSDGGGDAGWYFIDNLIEARGDAGIVATFALIDTIQTAAAAANLPCPFDGELVAIGYASVDTATDDVSTMTIKRFRGTTTANRQEDGPGVTFAIPTTAINAGGLVTLDDPISFRAGDGCHFLTDANSSTGGEFNIVAYFKVKTPSAICLSGHISSLGGATEIYAGAIRRGVVRRVAYCLQTDLTVGGNVMTMKAAGSAVVPARTFALATGAIAEGTGGISEHGEQFFDEGADFSYLSDTAGAGGESYCTVLLEQ